MCVAGTVVFVSGIRFFYYCMQNGSHLKLHLYYQIWYINGCVDQNSKNMIKGNDDRIPQLDVRI